MQMWDRLICETHPTLIVSLLFVLHLSMLKGLLCLKQVSYLCCAENSVIATNEYFKTHPS